MFRSMLSALVITLMSHAVQAQAPAPECRHQGVDDHSHRRSHRAILAGGDAPVRRETSFRPSYVDPSVKAFDDLKAGDVITVRYVESVVVQVRPGAALSDARDVTAEAQKAGNGQVLQQQKAVVKVESINPQGLSIEYRTKDGQKVVRHGDRTSAFSRACTWAIGLRSRSPASAR